ncbi:MAG: hypothetical protein ACI808_001118 [Paraglaciecola sp.]|jgi:hypothetical protein
MDDLFSRTTILSETKTRPAELEVKVFIQSIENSKRREDTQIILDLYSQISGEIPLMWGPSIIGYGSYEYILAGGKKSRFMRSGFSPRKQNLTLYLGAGLSVQPDFMASLGKYKTSKTCLYINKLGDVDLLVLQRLIKVDLDEMNRRYPE